jgi:hypothetical protein
MQDQYRVLFAVAFAAVAVIVILILASRTTSGVRERLRDLATSAGWSDLVDVSFLGSGVKGMWRSFPVQLVYYARQKSVPRRFILKVRAQADSRFIVKRMFRGFFSNRPLTWFGPPLIDVRQSAAAELWVRGDEGTLAERIFSDPKLTALISENLVARFDEIRIDRRGLRVTRALDERPVKEKYGLPLFFKADQAEPIAREELALASALVDKLSMLA